MSHLLSKPQIMARAGADCLAVDWDGGSCGSRSAIRGPLARVPGAPAPAGSVYAQNPGSLATQC